MCHEQPQPVPFPRSDAVSTRPPTVQSTQRLSHWVSNGRDLVTRASSRASFSAWRWTSPAPQRPSIGAPTDFRRVETDLAGRRASFRPLQLSIYLPTGRLSPLPDFSAEFPRESHAEPEAPQQALIRPRADSIMSFSSSNFLIQRKPVGSSVGGEGEWRSRRSLSSDMTLSDNEGMGSLFSSLDRSTCAFPVPPAPTRDPQTSYPRARASTEAPPPTHVRNSESLRRAKADVDDAIRELNTIVEERRADAIRCSASSIVARPHDHVPAIAPLMKVRARSETLSDIGSALSTPLTSKPLPEPPSPLPTQLRNRSLKSKLKLLPINTVQSGNAKVVDAEPVSPIAPGPFSAPMAASSLSRLSTWLRRSVPSTPTSPRTDEQSREQFYQLQLRSFPAPSRAPPPRPSSASSYTTATLSAVSSTSPSSPETLLTPPADIVKPRALTITTQTESITQQRQAPRKQGAPVAMLIPPPAYQEVDPHPHSPRTPVEVGVAF